MKRVAIFVLVLITACAPRIKYFGDKKGRPEIKVAIQQNSLNEDGEIPCTNAKRNNPLLPCVAYLTARFYGHVIQPEGNYYLERIWYFNTESSRKVFFARGGYDSVIAQIPVHSIAHSRRLDPGEYVVKLVVLNRGELFLESNHLRVKVE